MSARGPVSKDRLFSPGAGSGNLSSRHPAESASYGAFAGMGFATSTPTQSRNAAYEHATTYRTLLYEVNSDTTKITPTWGKVSETPWFGEARRLQGFGRPVLSVTTSKDAPLFISQRSSRYTEKLVEPKVPVNKEAQYVLPGGPTEEVKARADPARTRIVKLNWRNEVVFEPLVSARPSPAELNATNGGGSHNSAPTSSRNMNSGRDHGTDRGNNHRGSGREGGSAATPSHPLPSTRPATDRSHGGVGGKQRRH